MWEVSSDTYQKVENVHQKKPDKVPQILEGTLVGVGVALLQVFVEAGQHGLRLLLQEEDE